ncbi:MAG: hypothetical protein E7524_05620 [Ruminococcaceae bacterium]|nr:hypothetical protein [Oscillospiraceae bacterium]
MLTNDLRKSIIKDLKDKKLSIKEISEKYGVHRNTVGNINSELSNSQYDNSIYCKTTRTSKINKEYQKAIKNFCLENLNCYVYKDNLVEWAKKLCETLNIDFLDLVNYSPDKIVLYPPHTDRRLLLATIRRIRNYTYISKNYLDTYQKFQQTNYCGYKNISYESFYLCAKKYWIDIDFNGLNLGEIIDNTAKK